MMALLLALPGVPLAAALACLLPVARRAAPLVALGAGAATVVLAGLLTARVLAVADVTAADGWLHADALAALLALLIALTSLACLWYGRHYMAFVVRTEQEDARWAAGRFEALTLALVAAMLLAAVAGNLGLLWIAIEAATLASALLVGYYRRRGAIEAAWKYVILSSVGLSLALFGTVLLHAAGRDVLGEGAIRLTWTALRAVAPALDPRFVKLAFLFALAGYGAKAGLAPMHAWLPDAYGQAPTPSAALLATALLATSFGALLRFYAIAVAAAPGWAQGLFVLFGSLSLLVSLPFLVVQGEYKRLLAWSSLEHTGLMTLAIGFGSPVATFAALLHLLVQSFGKAVAFLVGGSLLRATGSRRIDHWHGALAGSPALGALLLGAGVTLVGLPPAATFGSEWLAVTGGLAGPARGPALLAVAALLVAFGGLAFHWTQMLLGGRREPLVDPLPADAQRPLWALLTLIVVLGAWLPAPLRTLLERAAAVVRP